MTTDENSRALWNDDGAGGLCNRSDNVTLPTDAVNKKYTHIVDKFDAFAVFFYVGNRKSYAESLLDIIKCMIHVSA